MRISTHGLPTSFLSARARRFRLDEIDWGGVSVNGIPPLEYPPAIAAAGETRAYPKRILAWHEMALDRVGGVELTIVYCTLCGTVIPYESVTDGEPIKFGTSGLLYRSNKLMFDHGTKRLWNTFEGVPVVGPLVGSGVRVTHRSVVTTTWGEWRRMHPETTVLSLETGYERDYDEGAAYQGYFSNDDLMFDVSELDDRLDNKDEVMVLLLDDADGVRHPLAFAVEFLEDHRTHTEEHAGRRLVVVTTRLVRTVCMTPGRRSSSGPMAISLSSTATAGGGGSARTRSSTRPIRRAVRAGSPHSGRSGLDGTRSSAMRVSWSDCYS